MSNEAKADDLMAQAEKKLKSSQGFFGGLFGCVYFYKYGISFMSDHVF